MANKYLYTGFYVGPNFEATYKKFIKLIKEDDKILAIAKSKEGKRGIRKESISKRLIALSIRYLIANYVNARMKNTMELIEEEGLEEELKEELEEVVEDEKQ